MSCPRTVLVTYGSPGADLARRRGWDRMMESYASSGVEPFALAHGGPVVGIEPSSFAPALRCAHCFREIDRDPARIDAHHEACVQAAVDEATKAAVGLTRKENRP